MDNSRKCGKCGGSLFNGTCTACGFVWEESVMVSDLTFGESSSGAAVVNGSFVSADRSGLDRIGNGLYGHGSANTKEITIEKAKQRIQGVAYALKIPEPVINAAIQNFKYALRSNFIRGRKSKYVTCACLYLGCRQKQSSHLLMEFATFLKINVYTLGHTYTQLLKAIYPIIGEKELKRTMFVDPSIYIQKFINRLNLTSDEGKKVYGDSHRIVRRMEKDWIIFGRRPAGVAAASVLIACRMNNIKRSKAKIMQIAMVAESTIDKRLKEFSSTAIGSLSIKEFRASNVGADADPPSFARNRKLERELGKRSIDAANRGLEERADIVITETESGNLVDSEGRNALAIEGLDGENDLTDENILQMAEEARQLYEFEDDPENDESKIDLMRRIQEDHILAAGIGKATLAAIENAKAELERAKARQGRKEEEPDANLEDPTAEENDEPVEQNDEEDEPVEKNDEDDEELFSAKEDEEDVEKENEEEENEEEPAEVENEEPSEAENDEESSEIEAENENKEQEKEEEQEETSEVATKKNEENEAEDTSNDKSENEDDEDQMEVDEEEKDDEDEENDGEDDDEDDIIKMDDEDAANSENGSDNEEDAKPKQATPVPPKSKEELRKSREERIAAILKRHNHPVSTLTQKITLSKANSKWENETDSKISDDPENLEDVDDAEIDGVICTPMEVQARERLWISLNKDYEIEQAHKKNKIEADKRDGIYKEPRKRVRHTRTGWGKSNNNENGGDQSATSVAVQMMMKKSKVLRVAKKSKKINYNVYEDILKAAQD